jgi:glycosyltransferase involved in cell wall biosynthesis
MSLSRKKTVCFYQIATHLGGAERSVLTILRGLNENPAWGIAPWVLLPRKEGTLVEELIRFNIEYDVLEMPEYFFKISRAAPVSATMSGIQSLPGMGMYLSQLKWMLEQKRPDLIHTNSIKTHLVSGLLSQNLKIPVLWHLRDILGNGPTLWGLQALMKLNKRVSPFYLVANSRATADSFKMRPVDVVYNGFDPKEYFPKKNKIFHELFNLPEQAPVVGIVGVLAKWKGQLEFIEMAERMIKAGTGVYFVIVGGEIYDTDGDAGFGQKLWEEAKKRKILDRVFFTGFRKDIPDVINGLDVLVHASTRPEPFGRVVIEAMACGVPVVASNAGGVLELITHNKTGLLVEPGNVKEMSEAVTQILGDHAMAKKFTKAGLDDFHKRFTDKKSLEAMVAVYNKILKAA